MKKRIWLSTGTFALLVVVALPVMADTQFTAKRMTRNDVPLGKGQCDIRLQVDKEAEVSVRGDLVHVRTISGRDARDDGSECNEPMPGRDLRGFNFEVRDSRGEIVLLSLPSPRNGYTVVVRIRDNKSGEGRYHFRLSWQMTGGGGFGQRPQPPVSPPGNRPAAAQALWVCQDAVTSQIVNQYRYGDVDIQNARVDDRPGRNDYIIGDATARRGFAKGSFTFVCSVDLRSGSLRSVNVRKR